MADSEAQPLISERTPVRNPVKVFFQTLAVIGVTVILGIGFSVVYSPIPLTEAVDAVNTFVHLRNLEIAAQASTADGGIPNRALGSPGYNATGEYVLEQLKKRTNYNVTVQPFTVTRFKVESLSLDILEPVVAPILSTGASFVYPLDSVDVPRATVKYLSGARFCDESLWEGADPTAAYHVSTTISILADECGFETLFKPNVAGIFVTLQIENNLKTMEDYSEESIMKGLNAAVGRKAMQKSVSIGPEFVLFARPGAELDLALKKHVFSRKASAVFRVSQTGEKRTTETFNILADTPAGDKNSIVVVGAHLDGVPYGSGINDDGSGTSTVLEMAIQLYRTGLSARIANKVRFAWWGAEEAGLLGSVYYTADLFENNKEELAKIALNLNHDMLGSPNGYPGIHDGTTYYANRTLYSPNVKIQSIYTDYFVNQLPGKNYHLAPLHAGSDHFSFLSVGVPAGGVETGAGGIKSVEQRKLYGGLANTPFDPCYHQSCDTVDNVSPELLDLMGKMCSHVVQELAFKPNLREWLWS
ncbi:hypothetical protein BJ742DRAFT_832819 [Cladochytrium replicatum]|nr:hypothetical protein BJ742DRAFT_832819 [Cladochytrium replicatum]